MSDAITCEEAGRAREGLRPSSSLTNYVGGEVISYRLPPRTETTWADQGGRDVLRDVLDANGCRHYRLDGDDDE